MAEDEAEDGEPEFWERPAGFWHFWWRAWKRALRQTWPATALPDRKADPLVFLIVVIVAGVFGWLAVPGRAQTDWQQTVRVGGSLAIGAVAGAFVLAGREAHRMHEEAAAKARAAWCSSDGPPRRELLEPLTQLEHEADVLRQRTYRGDEYVARLAYDHCAAGIKFFDTHGYVAAAALLRASATLLRNVMHEPPATRNVRAREALTTLDLQVSSARDEIEQAIADEAERLAKA
jgi:hypothetical protein